MATQAAAQQPVTESNQAGRTDRERLVAIETLLPTLATKEDLKNSSRT